METDLRRAVSTAYYALFHCLAECCADTIVGGRSANRSRLSWVRVYRALSHGAARDRCHDRTEIVGLSREILDFADTFVEMQQRRHRADYDPEAYFTRTEVLQQISQVENVILRFTRAPIVDRRSFAVHALMSGRRN